MLVPYLAPSGGSIAAPRLVGMPVSAPCWGVGCWHTRGAVPTDHVVVAKARLALSKAQMGFYAPDGARKQRRGERISKPPGIDTGRPGRDDDLHDATGPQPLNISNVSLKVATPRDPSLKPMGKSFGRPSNVT